MQKKIYFDTNVIRYFGDAFSAHPMEEDLRACILLSPVSALEVISQLAADTPQQAYSAIQAMWNWLPQKTGILDHPAVLLRRAVSDVGDSEDSRFFEEISKALTFCLNSKNPSEVADASAELRNLLDKSKYENARQRQDAVEQMRASLQTVGRKALSDEELTTAFQISIASRARTAPDDPKIRPLVNKLKAYYEYDTVRLKSAIAIKTYNFLSKKRKNDLFDAEQLIYLVEPHMNFITTDTGYKHLLTTIEQGRQIHLFKKDVLTNRESAIKALQGAIEE